MEIYAERRVQVLSIAGWKCLDHFSQLKQGEVFRMFEPYGEIVVNKDGCSEFVAISLPFIFKDDIWAVDEEPYIRKGDIKIL